MRHQRRARTLPLGTLAEATCRTCDWIDGLRWPLERMRLSKADRAHVRQLLAEYDRLPEAGLTCDWSIEEHEAASGILEELIDVAENYLAPYTRLGTLEGDGACFGVWPCVESLMDDVRDGEVWQRCARGDGYSKPGTVLLRVPRGELYVDVSDHGNVTLYQSLGGERGREVWGVV